MVTKFRTSRIASRPVANTIAAHAQQLFTQGFALHQKGRLAQAQKLYEAALNVQPKHFDALHLLGVIAYQASQFERAVELISNAIVINPRNAAAYSNHGLALSELKRLELAVQSYDKAIALKPDYAEAYYNRGLALHGLRRLEAALGSYDRAIRLKPDFAMAHNGRGLALVALNQFSAALQSYDRAIALQANVAETHSNRGFVLTKLMQYELALQSYDKAIALRPDHAESHYNRGFALQELRQLNAALQSYDRAIALKPHLAEAYTNRGITLHELKRFDSALSSFDRAIALDSDLAEPHHYRGLVHLEIGNYRQGWEGYEWRWKTKDWKTPKLNLDIPAWSGDRSKTRLLIWAEQGIGDEILYCSILQSIEDFPQQKTVAADERLLPLLERSLPTFKFLSKTNIGGADRFDEQLPMGSLGQFFRTSDEAFKDLKSSYLTADITLTNQLRSKVRHPEKLVCGLSWISKNARTGEAKSLSLADLLPILSLKHVDFVDLQYGDTYQERQEIKRTQGIEIKKIEEIDNFSNIDGLASLIDACDLVITVSNTTAHLAGALGKETLLLLPSARGKLWYWRSMNGISLWYPSVRIYEQARIGAWDSPIARVCSDLEARKPTHSSPD